MVWIFLQSQRFSFGHLIHLSFHFYSKDSSLGVRVGENSYSYRSTHKHFKLAISLNIA